VVFQVFWGNNPARDILVRRMGVVVNGSFINMEYKVIFFWRIGVVCGDFLGICGKTL
jgi:hypothetical protein